MKVLFKENGPLDGFDIWILDGQGHQVMYQIDSEEDKYRAVWTTMPPGELTAPSLRLTEDVLRAMLQEAGKVIPATHATERHLLREIEVSDRLLTLVERAIP